MTQTMAMSWMEQLQPFLKDGARVRDVEGLPTAEVKNRTAGLEANAYYFGHPVWAPGWFKFVHRYPQLRERWHATGGTWDGKVVVDVGCGPGNLFASVGGKPEVLIGVDISKGTLLHAAEQGYVPLLADAQEMPLRDECADLVTLNATIHHVDDMRKVLTDSARLVKRGGLLMADHDPHKPAYELRWLGKLLWKIREPIYRFMKRGGHNAANDEQKWAFATEIHHKPGDGVTEELLRSTLEPMGFEVKLYPHNHKIGREVLDGQMGIPPRKMRVAQRLSGINPMKVEGAMSLLCVARRK